MARFRGTIEGDRGGASRLGHRSITTNANGWNVGVNVDGGGLKDGGDEFTVWATGGSHDRKRSHLIAEVVEVKGLGVNKRQVTVYNGKGSVVARYVV